MRLCVLLIALSLGGLSYSSPAHADPLENICRSVDNELARGRTPVVVFNVDGTILDNRPRSAAILRDFVQLTSESCAEIADSVLAMKTEEIDYYIVESFKRCGIRNLFFVESALRYWADNFFSNRYVKLDIPIDGAAEFVKHLHDRGAMIVYVSGRDREKMLEGTVESLKISGFPIATDRSMLIMKSVTDSDVVYKKETYERINRFGKVVAAFDNEPAEVSTMKRSWPHASVFMVKMPHSSDQGLLPPGTSILNSYHSGNSANGR